MHYRALGRSGIKVSEISMGCNRLGQAGTPDQEWVDLVRRAVELGVNLFDTAESYGWGRSEEILGQALVGRGDIHIASKVSRSRETGEKSFTQGLVIASAEGSLRRLKRDCLDVLQLHSPSMSNLQHDDWLEGMRKLQEQGKIRWVGVSINDVESGRWLIENGMADVLQVDYSMLEPGVGREVFPLAERHGVGILVRMPMARGILTGKFTPGQEVGPEHRASLNRERVPEQVRQAEAFRPLAEGKEITLGQFALRYAITPTGVSAAIPGARTLEQLEQNVAASNGFGLSAAELAAAETIQRQLGL